jgi:acetyl-CoA acetyltransferase
MTTDLTSRAREFRGGSAIAGIGETALLRSSDCDLRELAAEAALAALADAGLEIADVDGIITDDEFSALTCTGSELAGMLGMRRTFMVQAPSAGAGYVYAPLLAAMAIAAGEATVVLCFLSLDFGSQSAGVATFGYQNEGTDREEFEEPFGFTGTPVYYAMAAQRYRMQYGLLDEQLGELAVTIRNNGAAHPRAQMRRQVTMADYLSSPYIAEPLRLLDCCLQSVGAGAFVVTSPERARDLRQPPVVLLGAGYAASPVSRRHSWVQRPEYPTTLTSVAAARAYAMAGLTPADVDVAELQDPYTIAALMQLESCGFCGKGEAGRFVQDGHVRLDGDLPVNTHGGQLSHGYLFSIPHIIEAVRQLRGEALANQVPGAETALISGLGPGDSAVLLLGGA